MEAVKIKYKTYPSYKDSGVDWLGKIPKSWESRRVKSIFRLIVEPAPKDNNEELLSVYTDIGVKPRKELEERGNKASTTDGYWKVKKGDVIVNKLLAWMGAIGVSDYDGVTSPAYDILRAYKPISGSFYHNLFRLPTCVSELRRHSRGIMDMRLRLYFDKFGDVIVPYPPIQEQTAIANFLDNKTAKIDQAITQKEKLIELLKERKQILIQNAVTKGLDPNVKMKDSGVKWIGEIPEHWVLKKVRFLFKFWKGLNITKENLQDEGVPCVSYGEIHSKYGFEVSPSKHELKCVDREYLKDNKNAVLNYGDFVFADTSEDVEGSGNFTYLNSNDIVFAGYHTVIARQKENHAPRFLAYVFNSLSYRNQIRRKVKGVKVYSITNAILKNTTIWLPTKKEQEIIIDYCDNILLKFDNLISLQQIQIEKLKEYKTTLIDSVVTGKIKVKSN